MTSYQQSVNPKTVLNNFKDNPDLFFAKVLGASIWEKQKEILESVRLNRRTTVRSCNGAGKTWLLPRLALWFLASFPNSIVINTAPIWKQVEDQYWRHFAEAYKLAKIPLGGKILKTRFDISNNWFALGVSVKHYNPVDFQGWHGENILVIFDEASGIHPNIWEAMEGLISGGATSRFVAIGNPNTNSGAFFDTFTDPRYNKIHISAFDLPNVKEKKNIITGISTYEWVEEMRIKYGENSDVYRVRVLGEPPIHQSDTLISVQQITDAIDSDRERYGDEECIGVDCARFGNDRSAIVYRKGNYAKVLEVLDKNDMMELAGKVKVYLKQYQNADAYIDIIGNGAGVFDRLREQPDVSSRVKGVSSSGKPREDDYINIRAESWANARSWIKDAILERHEGWYQLAQPKYKIASNGKLQLESKEDMKKRGVSSPDVADALCLTLSKATEGDNLGVHWL